MCMNWFNKNKRRNPELLFLYRNANYGKPGTQVLGLGVNVQHSVPLLRDAGFTVNSAGVWLAGDIAVQVDLYKPDIVIIEAPWANLNEFLPIVAARPKTHFTVRCHSNINFLQVEPDAITLLRELQLYSESLPNLSISMNSESLREFFHTAYGGNALYLPNLYRLKRPERLSRKKFVPGDTLRIASWGATRLQKNHTVAAASALMLGRDFDSPVEFYMNSTGGAGAEEIIRAVKNMYGGLSWAKFIDIGWKSWQLFRREVARMDICLHMSGTETFNLTTADALAEGVPVVGSIAIDWLRDDWKANHDDERDIVKVARKVLLNNRSSDRAIENIRNIADKNLTEWKKELQYGFKEFGIA